MLTIVVEGCGVVVVPSLAGEDLSSSEMLAALISMTRRGRRDTRMSVTLMKGSSARCPSSQSTACRVDQQPLIVALHDRRLAVLTSMVEGCGVVVVPSSAGEDANADF